MAVADDVEGLPRKLAKEVNPGGNVDSGACAIAPDSRSPFRAFYEPAPASVERMDQAFYSRRKLLTWSASRQASAPDLNSLWCSSDARSERRGVR